MDVFENCKTLNDIARQVFGKANYYNRERCKKILFFQSHQHSFRQKMRYIKRSSLTELLFITILALCYSMLSRREKPVRSNTERTSYRYHTRTHRRAPNK